MYIFAIYLLVLSLKLCYGDFFNEIALQEWESFKVKYNKTYETGVSEISAFQTYAKKLKMIHDHNLEYENGSQFFEMGVNQFSDMSDEEVNRIMNGARIPDDNLWNDDTYGEYFIPTNVDIPEFINWTASGAVTPVKSQGQCGSCWAFSATGGLEGQHFIKKKSLPSLSEQNLVDCTRNYGNYGCGGGWMNSAYKYIQDNKGIDTETGYPYEAQDKTCRYNKATKGSTDSGFIKIPSADEHALMEAVANVGPITVAIDASRPSFHSYKRGVYWDDSCSRTGHITHAVLVVGYGIEDGMEYWLVKNSWDTWWGDQGYIKMLRFRSVCSIAHYASYPKVD